MRSHPYQWRALLLMMLAWSVIGLVHNGISFLFPYFSETFALSTAHNGYLTGTLAFFWTLSILVNGPLADRIGQVRLMVPESLVASATSFAPACGECMGGVVAPVVAGMISGAVGTSQVMHLLILLPFLVAGGVLLLRETAPAVLERRRAR